MVKGYNFLLICCWVNSEFNIMVIFLNCSSRKTNPGLDMNRAAEDAEGQLFSSKAHREALRSLGQLSSG